MPLPQTSLAVVGADFPNKRGPARRFEIAVCSRGETVDLRPEPSNPADPRAVAVFSSRGVQIGYLTAERCGRIGSLIKQGRTIVAIFQEPASYGAVIRVAFDGDKPIIPESRSTPSREEGEFWPDEIWPDDGSQL